MTAVNKLTADKLKFHALKKRKLDDKGKKAELKARLVEAPASEHSSLSLSVTGELGSPSAANPRWLSLSRRPAARR